jgi:gluconate 2-dehydrogenase gamma chain
VSEGDGISRRDLLRAGVGATIAAPLAAAALPAAATAAAAAGVFFSAAELGLLDELTEMIVPADEHSGGARAAAVAAYLDRTLAEKDPEIEDHAAERQRFKDGLARVDELTRATHGSGFLEATFDQRLKVLERMAANEDHPEAPEERFFVELKRATTHAYYSSRVGMIDEMEYRGNRVIREFVGTDVSKG